MANLSVCFR